MRVQRSAVDRVVAYLDEVEVALAAMERAFAAIRDEAREMKEATGEHPVVRVDDPGRPPGWPDP